MQTSNNPYTLLDRNRAKMPDYYLPEAPGVAIADNPLLRAVGYHPGSKRPRDWFKFNRGVFRHRTCRDGMILQVRTGDAKFWVVERFHEVDLLDPSGRYPGLNVYALVCAHSGRPIWASSYQCAMRLARYCHPIPQPPIVGCWVPAREREHAEFVARYESERARRQRVVASASVAASPELTAVLQSLP